MTIIFTALFRVSGYHGDRDASRGTYEATQARARIACEQQKSADTSCSHGFDALLDTQRGSLPEQRTLRPLHMSQVLAYLRLVGVSDIPVGDRIRGRQAHSGSERMGVLDG